MGGEGLQLVAAAARSRARGQPDAHHLGVSAVVREDIVYHSRWNGAGPHHLRIRPPRLRIAIGCSLRHIVTRARARHVGPAARCRRIARGNHGAVERPQEVGAQGRRLHVNHRFTRGGDIGTALRTADLEPHRTQVDETAPKLSGDREEGQLSARMAWEDCCAEE
eukprot:3110140-Prymnesium_polylepis.1